MHQTAIILSADIKGYTAIVQQDEARGRVVRDKFHKIIESDCKKYNGQVTEFIGDGVVCVFKSSAAAVRAAISIQQQMMDHPKVPLRIGIHCGEVLFEDNNVYGEEVNIASRIESLGVAGSIFISGKVFDGIKDQPDIKTISLGKVRLKDAKSPLEIYAVSNLGLVVPPKKKLKVKELGQIFWFHSYKIWGVTLFITTVLVLSCWLIYSRFIQKSHKMHREKSIAVLPFSNLSHDKNDVYFADGICNEIVSQLEKISELRVISQNSTAHYEKSADAIGQLARELNVEFVLSGTVQKAPDQMRISLQLISAAANKIIWTDVYYRKPEDILTIQNDVAKEVAGRLHATLSPDENRSINIVPTSNSVAYQNYLQGNYFLDKRTPDGMLRSKAYFEKAIAADSNFVAAYIGLAYSYIFRSNFYDIIPGEGYPAAKKLIVKSLAMDPDLADAHAALGIVYGFHDWNFPLAEKEFQQALLLDRNNKIARLGYGRCLYSSKKFNASLAIFNDALRQDPLWRQPLNSIAWVYFFKHRYDSSLLYIRKNQELYADFFQPYRLEGLIQLHQEKNTEALQLFQKAVTLSGNNPEELAYLGYGYAKNGNHTEAEKIIAELKKQQGDSKMLSFPIAVVYAGFENKAKTFEYLEMARIEKTSDIMLVDVFPQFDFLRQDDQYEAFEKLAGIIYLK